MNEIEKLEAIKLSLESGIVNSQKLIDIHNLKITQLKKADEVKEVKEVKPVFSRSQSFALYIDTKTAHGFGMTADDCDELCEIRRWFKSRACIIERINVINKGNNGFKRGEYNYIINIDANESFNILQSVIQSHEPLIHGRDGELMKDLLKCDTFKAHCKTYFGVAG